MPDVRDAIVRQGSNPATSASPEEFGRFIKAESDKFRPVVKAAGLEGSQ
jgi:tripartite-type tricarboxylate transporter receptor subunit TctC